MTASARPRLPAPCTQRRSSRPQADPRPPIPAYHCAALPSGPWSPARPGRSRSLSFPVVSRARAPLLAILFALGAACSAPAPAGQPAASSSEPRAASATHLTIGIEDAPQTLGELFLPDSESSA